MELVSCYIALSFIHIYVLFNFKFADLKNSLIVSVKSNKA